MNGSGVNVLAHLLEIHSSFKSASDPGFDPWRDEAIQALQEFFGPTAHYTKEFEGIRFRAPPELIKKARKKLPRFVVRDDKVPRLLSSPAPIAEARQFAKAMVEAAAILRNAKTQLDENSLDPDG